MSKELQLHDINDHEYSALAMRILAEIRKEYPTTTTSQVNAILDNVRDWVSLMVISWNCPEY